MLEVFFRPKFGSIYQKNKGNIHVSHWIEDNIVFTHNNAFIVVSGNAKAYNVYQFKLKNFKE